jgi:hypothetical protein
MKKHLWIVIIFSCFLLVGGWVFISSLSINVDMKFDKQKYFITVQGAVSNKLESWVNEGTKRKEVVYRAHLLIDADISNLNLEKAVSKDEIIHIPYKEGAEPKIDARDGLTKSEIDKLGLNKNLSAALFKLFEEKNNHITWDDIDQLPGTGEVIMAKLKKLLIIQN